MLYNFGQWHKNVFTSITKKYKTCVVKYFFNNDLFWKKVGRFGNKWGRFGKKWGRFGRAVLAMGG